MIKSEVFNKYGNLEMFTGTGLDHGKSRVGIEIDGVEKVIFKVVVEVLDGLDIDEAMFVVRYVNSGNAALLAEYIESREPDANYLFHRNATGLKVVSKRLSRRLQYAVTAQIKPYLDCRSYPDVLLLSAYISNNIHMVLSAYLLSRQMLENGRDRGDEELVNTTQKNISKEYARAGMQDPVISKLIDDVAKFTNSMSAAELDQLERDAGMDGSRYDD